MKRARMARATTPAEARGDYPGAVACYRRALRLLLGAAHDPDAALRHPPTAAASAGAAASLQTAMQLNLARALVGAGCAEAAGQVYEELEVTAGEDAQLGAGAAVPCIWGPGWRLAQVVWPQGSRCARSPVRSGLPFNTCPLLLQHARTPSRRALQPAARLAGVGNRQAGSGRPGWCRGGTAVGGRAG